MNATAFLDTNVLANWIFLDASLKSRGVKKKELFQALPRYVPSYDLMEQVRTDKNLQGILTTSRLAYAEILSVLIDEYVDERMHDQGILAKYFTQERHSVKLTPSDVGDILKQLQHFTTEFIIPSRFIQFVEDEYENRPLVTLMTILRVETYDAILIATAEFQKCSYFITEDSRLRDTLKRAGYPHIAAVSAQDYLSRINRKKPRTIDLQVRVDAKPSSHPTKFDNAKSEKEPTKT